MALSMLQHAAVLREVTNTTFASKIIQHKVNAESVVHLLCICMYAIQFNACLAAGGVGD